MNLMDEEIKQRRGRCYNMWQSLVTFFKYNRRIYGVWETMVYRNLFTFIRTARLDLKQRHLPERCGPALRFKDR